jgi:hypothetical protein
MVDGGEGVTGWRHSPKTKKKMSQSQKNRAPRPPHTAEARKKISESLIGTKRRVGKRHSEETKRRLSEMSASKVDAFRQHAHMGPIAMSKPVLCVDDGMTFESASAAARHYGIARSALIELCRGAPHRKTVGGLRFKYIGD